MTPIPRFRHRLLALSALGVAGQLSACAPPQQAPVAALPPNPYGYLRPAAVCDVPTLGRGHPVPPAITMTVGNDGGFCAARFAQPGGGPFASFLVTDVPHHGDPLIYNYNEQTLVTYTPSTGYAGPDAMTVEFVPGPGQPRSTLHIAITVRPAAVARS